MITKEAIEAGYAAAQVRDIRDERSHKERFVDGLTAAFAAMPGPAVQLKPLEWAGNEARSPVGCYRVQRLDGKWEPLRDGYYMLPRLHGIVKAFDTIEAAKAAAQADYEARILSALTPAPDLASENERLRAALGAIIANHETVGAGASIFQCTTAEVDAAKAALDRT